MGQAPKEGKKTGGLLHPDARNHQPVLGEKDNLCNRHYSQAGLLKG